MLQGWEGWEVDPGALEGGGPFRGSPQGLIVETRKTNAGWVARFGEWAGAERRVMDQSLAREWLTDLVNTGKKSFSTQKQALNALVFFYRDGLMIIDC